jgi:hypothetical protein
MQKISAGKFHFALPSRFTSLDHLVGGHEQAKRDGEAERLCRLEAYNQSYLAEHPAYQTSINLPSRPPPQ